MMMFDNRYLNVIYSFVALLAIIKLTHSQNRNLCDLCECLPSYVEPTYVNCNCKKSKVLIFKEEHNEILFNTKVLNISTCSFVSFPPGGFPKAKKIRSLQIRQMSLFHLIGGVFPSVVNIVIDDISELIVDGFHGQTSLTVVEIKNSVFTEIVEDTFKEVKNLEKLTFQNVSINTIAPSSLYIPSGSSKLAVKFISCKIDTIQSEAISLHISKFEISQSTINVIDSYGLNLTATDSVDIIRSNFGALVSPESLRIRSKQINIVENEFNSLPTNLLKDVHVFNDKRTNFTGNVIHDIDLGGFLLSSKMEKLNFVKNKIACDCTPRKTSILRLRELFPGLLNNETNFDAIIENNSCRNYNGIYLSEFKKKFLAGHICNETAETRLFESQQQTDQYYNQWLNATGSESTAGHDNNAAVSSSNRSYTIIILISILPSYLYSFRYL